MAIHQMVRCYQTKFQRSIADLMFLSLYFRKEVAVYTFWTVSKPSNVLHCIFAMALFQCEKFRIEFPRPEENVGYGLRSIDTLGHV